MPDIAFVPQLDATLITRRHDIATCEKNVEVFSSYQPDGLMSRLMGENMMRKDGECHLLERRANHPCFSPAAVKTIWRPKFKKLTKKRIDLIKKQPTADLFREYAMPVSADALRHVTGLTNLTAERMNAVSQGMIDGCNYKGDTAVKLIVLPAPEIDVIDAKWDHLAEIRTAHSSVQQQTGFPKNRSEPILNCQFQVARTNPGTRLQAPSGHY